jgi:PAS domain S-box-containing protein
MKTSEHADRTERLVGTRADDIHKWIDGFFDFEGFEDFLKSENYTKYDPYDHRKFRHCAEALDEAYEAFKDKYTKEQIKAVFESHIRDDYNGYIPKREDFENGTFTEMYHDNDQKTGAEAILSEQELSEYFKGKSYARRNRKDRKLGRGFLLKIVLPTLLSIVLFVTTVFAIIVPVFRSGIMERKREMIKELTTSAIGVIEHYILLEKQGQLERTSAQEMAAIAVESMKYGMENKDYFWITDMHPRMIMHPYRKDLKGTDLSDFRDIMDKSGKKLFVEFVKIAKEKNEGYTQYLWQWKDDETRVVPKLSFVKGIPHWDWIIGTGVYIDDVEEEVSGLTKNILRIFSLISALLIIMLGYVIYQSRRLNNDLIKAESGLIEAKDRYKALVEASNEGHILEVEGKNIYSNFTLQKMLGYSEKDIASLSVWELLDPDSKINLYGIEHLKKLSEGQTMSGEFEAQVKTAAGDILDVVISTARIFFLKKKGHVISIRKILRRKENSIIESLGGTQYYPGSLFLTKKVKQISRKIDISGEENIKDTISGETPVYEALEKLKKSGRDNIYVVDDAGTVNGIIGYYDIAMMYSGMPTGMLYEIENSESTGHVVRTLNRMPDMIREMTAQGARSDTLREILSRIYLACLKLFIKFSMEESGVPPVKFAFISLGSVARQEMTMFSDQDNALIFEDGEDNERSKKYFLRFADRVCSKLNEAGYQYCPGGIMAFNPKWCLPLSEWKNNFSGWIENATEQSILEINVFFDLRCDYGDDRLVSELNEFVFKKAEENPQFFIHFANNCLNYRLPINILGKIRSETRDGSKTFNIKQNLIPIINFGRILSLKYRISEPNTLKRLKSLLEKGVMTDKEYRERVYVFNHLWHFRYYNQIISHSDLKKVNDELDLEILTEIERQNLKNVLAEITYFQAKISTEFLDGTL